MWRSTPLICFEHILDNFILMQPVVVLYETRNNHSLFTFPILLMILLTFSISHSVISFQKWTVLAYLTISHTVTSLFLCTLLLLSAIHCNSIKHSSNKSKKHIGMKKKSISNNRKTFSVVFSLSFLIVPNVIFGFRTLGSTDQKHFLKLLYCRFQWL